MNNPWKQLNSKPPFVLFLDQTIINEHNRSSKIAENYKIQTELYPEPFIGNPNANIVLLNLNPGFSEGDIEFHRNNEHFINLVRKNLFHNSKYFYLLDERIKEAPGYNWWRKRLRILIETCGQESVARNIFCLELFPYHSKNFKKLQFLESQKYSAFLVQKAISRKSTIIVMRSRQLWIDLNPNIEKYQNCFSLKNPRSPYITNRNLPEGVFDHIVESLNKS